MLVAEYDPDLGLAIPDGRVESQYDVCATFLFTAGGNARFIFSTENIFTRIRVGVKRGEISPDDVVFEFKGETLHINPDGTLDTWPTGFHDQHEKFLAELLG